MSRSAAAAILFRASVTFWTCRDGTSGVDTSCVSREATGDMQTKMEPEAKIPTSTGDFFLAGD